MQVPSLARRERSEPIRRTRLLNGVRAAWPFALLTVVAIILGLPFFWMIITSLKPVQEVIVYPPRWLPQEVRLENFVDAWQAAPFGRFYFNSIVTGVATTVLQVVFAAFMAYAFVYIRFPAKRFLFLLVLATMMVPLEMKLVPNYILLSKLDWINTYWALIIPPAAHAFPVFVLEQQFRTLPRDLIDAAKVDGANHFQILVRIVTPISRPLQRLPVAPDRDERGRHAYAAHRPCLSPGDSGRQQSLESAHGRQHLRHHSHTAPILNDAKAICGRNNTRRRQELTIANRSKGSRCGETNCRHHHWQEPLQADV